MLANPVLRTLLYHSTVLWALFITDPTSHSVLPYHAPGGLLNKSVERPCCNLIPVGFLHPLLSSIHIVYDKQGASRSVGIAGPSCRRQQRYPRVTAFCTKIMKKLQTSPGFPADFQTFEEAKPSGTYSNSKPPEEWLTKAARRERMNSPGNQRNDSLPIHHGCNTS